MREVFYTLFIILQIAIGYNLVLPFILFLAWKIKRPTEFGSVGQSYEMDYGIIVTAYVQTHSLPALVNSILKSDYSNFVIYIVADNCDISQLSFTDTRVVLLRPPEILASNTKSHRYAMANFIRAHDYITILDSDNLVHPNYLNELNIQFNKGYQAVQGLRKPKNLNTTIAALDAARDLYYHFYDGKVLFEIGSSATLSGSGMAFKTELYSSFLDDVDVIGAGFDKVLQYWLVKSNQRIGFCEYAIVFDEKTSKTGQLVQQRSRWINTWFRYFQFGFRLIFLGIKRWSLNECLFGIILLRPPLFLFILLAVLFLFINIFLSFSGFLIWLAGLLVFALGFLIALKESKADKIIYRSLINIPTFIFYQLVSLFNSINANKKSMTTEHFHSEELDTRTVNEDRSNQREQS